MNDEIKIGDNGCSQGGTVTCYEPQYYCTDKRRWLSIPAILNNLNAKGIPISCTETIKTVVGYLPYEAAMAFAYSYLATARGVHNWGTKVRLIAYEMKYDVRTVCKGINELKEAFHNEQTN